LNGAAARLHPVADEESSPKSVGFLVQQSEPPLSLAWRMRRESWIAWLAVLMATNRPLPSCVPEEERKEAFDLIMRAQIKVETNWGKEEKQEPEVENDGDTR